MDHMPMISERCKRVIAILSSSFLEDPAYKYLTDIAIHLNMKNKDNVLIPVIYKNERLSMHTSIDILTKLKYNPKSFNFWKILMKSFDIYDLSEEEMKMDFQG